MEKASFPPFLAPMTESIVDCQLVMAVHSIHKMVVLINGKWFCNNFHPPPVASPLCLVMGTILLSCMVLSIATARLSIHTIARLFPAVPLTIMCFFILPLDLMTCGKPLRLRRNVPHAPNPLECRSSKRAGLLYQLSTYTWCPLSSSPSSSLRTTACPSPLPSNSSESSLPVNNYICIRGTVHVDVFILPVYSIQFHT